jgi:hypothetical protein
MFVFLPFAAPMKECPEFLEFTTFIYFDNGDNAVCCLYLEYI